MISASQSLSLKGTVSNLSKHLKIKHFITAPTIPAKIARQEPEVNLLRSLTSSETTSNTYADGQQASELTTNDVAPSGFSQSAPTTQTDPQPSACKNVQPTLRMFSNTKKLSNKQRKEIDDALMLLFYKSFLPFSIVEDENFKKIVSILNPAYQLPSRKHVSNTLSDADYHSTATEVKEKLAKVDSACLTIDCWTSRAQEGYLAVTAHYVDNSFNLQTTLLQCRILSGPHTASNLSTELDEVINEWNLTKKIQLVVSDNAPNVQNCIKDLNLKNFRFLLTP